MVLLCCEVKWLIVRSSSSQTLNVKKCECVLDLSFAGPSPSGTLGDFRSECDCYNLTAAALGGLQYSKQNDKRLPSNRVGAAGWFLHKTYIKNKSTLLF